MIIRSVCPTWALVAWCRALKHGLGVGLSPVRVFQQQAKSGPAPLRPVAERIAARLDTGDSLSDALQPEVGRFPVLFVESIAVGEHAGRLVDILGELENHYTAMQSARKRLIASLMWPAFSLCSGIVVISLLIFVLGMVNPNMDALGLGLTGTKGAMIFFLTAVGILCALMGTVQTIANDENLKSKALGLAMSIPGLASCVRAFALQRFSLAWRFMAEAGVKADRTMASALRATANRAYREKSETASKKLRKGGEVCEVLADCGTKLFPEEYQEAARIGEETGQLAEVMGKQALHYQDESERKMKLVTSAAGVGIYMMMVLLMILAIGQLFMHAYINPMNEQLNMIENMK